MVAPCKTRRVVCLVVRVADAPEATPSRPIASRLAPRRLSRKPSSLLPWADPYIAGLVRRLQSEVRRERARLSAKEATGDQWSKFTDRGAYRGVLAEPWADLEPPSPAVETEWEWYERPQWTIEGEPVE